jgi:glutaredoxin-related protein
MAAYDGNIYILTSEPCQLITLDDSYNIINIKDVSRSVSAIEYAREYEFISVIEDTLYCGFRKTDVSNRYGLGAYEYASVDLNNPTIRRAIYQTSEFNTEHTLYINNSNNAYTRDGSEQNPFNNIYEALNCLGIVDVINIRDNSTIENTYILHVSENKIVDYTNVNSVAKYSVYNEYGKAICRTGTKLDYSSIEGETVLSLNVGGTTAIARPVLPEELTNRAIIGLTGSTTNIDIPTAPSPNNLNVGAFAMDTTSHLNFTSYPYVALNNLIQTSEPTAPTNTKNLHGVQGSLTTDTLTGLYIPIKCDGEIFCRYNNVGLAVPFTANGQTVRVLLGSNATVGFDMARVNQSWARLTSRNTNDVTVTQIYVWKD